MCLYACVCVCVCVCVRACVRVCVHACMHVGVFCHTDKDAQVAGCDHAKSPKKMCKKLCGNLPADELAKIYCNASMSKSTDPIVVLRCWYL